MPRRHEKNTLRTGARIRGCASRVRRKPLEMGLPTTYPPVDRLLLKLERDVEQSCRFSHCRPLRPQQRPSFAFFPPRRGAVARRWSLLFAFPTQSLLAAALREPLGGFTRGGASQQQNLTATKKNPKRGPFGLKACRVFPVFGLFPVLGLRL